MGRPDPLYNTRCNALILLAVLLCWPVRATTAPAPLDFKGLYEFEFAGMPFGRVGVEAEQSDSHYAITVDVMSTGVLRLFAPHSSHTTVDAAGAGFAYPNITYDTHYQTKKKKRSVKLVYKDGKIIEEDVQPPDNRDKRPAVPQEMKEKAYDLLSLNLAMRERIAGALASGDPHFSLTVYDGRRLTQMDATVAGRRTIHYAGNRKYPVVTLAVRRKLLAGFTASEIADYDPKEPTLWIHFSDNERLVPVVLEIGFFFGKIKGALVKECRTGESCLLGIKE